MNPRRHPLPAPTAASGHPMPVEYRTGDLFAQHLPALAHGCNCAGVMGAGIAAQFRRRWPGMYEQYRGLCHTNVLRPGGIMPYWAADGTLVYNLATQDRPGRHATLTAVRAALTAMVEHAEDHYVDRIGLPRLGAGIGGLRWPDVAAAIEQTAAGGNVQIVVVSLPESGQAR